MNKLQLGKYIAETRRQIGLTQKELAAMLFITDKAVSKWERGLSYPDVTLLEPLADALGLSVSELMNGQKEQSDDVDQQVRAVINIADDSQKILKKHTVIITVLFCLLSAALVAGAIFLLSFFKQTTLYVQVLSKQAETDGFYIYAEYEEELLRLKCPDQRIYDSIVAENFQWYQLECRFNRLSCEGELIKFAKDNTIIGDPTCEVGSVVGLGSLLGIEYVLKEYVHIWKDPRRENDYLYCMRFYYEGDGKAYYEKDKFQKVELLEIESCREVIAQDYDDDGIVELFVLTNYRTQPYCIYDLVDGSIITTFTNNIPSDIEMQLHAVL